MVSLVINACVHLLGLFSGMYIYIYIQYLESRYNAVVGVQGTTVLPLMVNTLGLYGHAIPGVVVAMLVCGRHYNVYNICKTLVNKTIYL